ncbi:MAG TPA: YceI family protein [Fulvivirga sp.]|nr:YceI family protein [Fulvivirga sp.]
MRNIATILLLIFAGFTLVNAQNHKLDNANSKLVVLGTSTIHDWEIVAGDIASTANYSMENNQVKITQLDLIIKVESLKSGKSSMDKNTYEALKNKQFPQIRYVLKEAHNIAASDEIKTSGVLTIAGVSQTIQMIVKAKTTGGKTNFTGKIPLKMTDFKIDPPTAIMGTIKTGDEITIEFNIQYN